MTKRDKRMAEKIRTGNAVVYRQAIHATGRPASYESGPEWARHHLLTVRGETAPRYPRTVRTTHDGRRVLMRRTERLRWV